MSVKRKDVISDENLDVLAEALFRIVEDNYIRRSVYKAKVEELEDRIGALEAIYTYQFAIEQQTDLTLQLPDYEDPSVELEINEDSGDLMLSMDDGVSSGLENFSFDVPNEDLILTV